MPTSTVVMPSRAAVTGPMVEPHGRSLRMAKRCSGTLACSAARATRALPGASVA